MVDQARGWVVDGPNVVEVKALLTADHAAGATVLLVTDAEPFSEEVAGQVRVNGTTYDYESADLDADTVTLATGLGADALEGDVVYLWKSSAGRPYAELEAEVEFENTADLGDDDTAPVKVSQSVADRLPQVADTEERGAAVLLQRDDGSIRWRIVEIDGEPLEIDLSSAIPDTIPDPSPATEAPASSPALEAQGTAEFIVLNALDDVAPSDWVTYQVSTDWDPVAETGTWADLPNMPTRATVVNVGATAAGLLQPEVPYWFRSVAGNIVDDAPPSDPVSASLDPTRVSDLFQAFMHAGVAEVGRLKVGPGYWDPDEGMVIPQDNGQETRISTNPEVPSTWAGKVVSYFVTIMAGLISGLVEVVGGTIRLMKGVSAPKDAPVPASYWQTFQLAETGNLWGLCPTADGGLGSGWVTHDRTAKITKIFDQGNGDLLDWFANPWPGAVHQITMVAGAGGAPGHYAILRSTTSGALYVTVTDDGWVETDEWGTGLNTGSMNGSPTIGVDESGNLIVGWATSVYAAVQRFTLAGATVGGQVFYDKDSTQTIGAVQRGAFDLGATRVVAWPNATSVRIFQTAGARETTNEWARAYGGEVRGAWWDGTRWRSLSTGGVIYEYETNVTAQTNLWAQSFVSEDGNRETQVGPTVSFTQGKRAGVQVVASQPPEFSQTGADKANRRGLYAGATVGALKQQVELPVGEAQYITAAVTTGGKAPEASNGFAGVSSVGVFETESGAIQFKGDDSFTNRGNPTDQYDYVAAGTTYTGTLSFARYGDRIFVSGTLTRNTTFNATFHSASGGTVPTWARPSATRYLNCGVLFGSAVKWRARVLTDGTVEIQESAADPSEAMIFAFAYRL